jgi:hypothetical protein
MSNANDLKVTSEVYQTSNTPGWDYIDKYINEQIDTIHKDFESKAFHDLSAVALLQGELAGLRKVLIFVSERRKRVEEGRLRLIEKGD